jgi:hypothetical protein
MIVIDPEVLRSFACSCYAFVSEARASLFDGR